MSSIGVTKLLEMGQKQFPFFSVRKKTQQSPVTPLRCFISVVSVSHSDTVQLSRFSLNMHHTEGYEKENYRKVDGKCGISKHKNVEGKFKLGTCPVM